MALFKALAATAVFMAGSALAEQQLSIATGGTGGVYYPMGGGLAEIINSHVDGYGATAEATGASVENMGLVARGEADLALALADTVVQAHSGTGRFEGQPLDMVRSVATLYTNMIQIVTLDDSGITRLEDLRGKRVSVGAPGSGTTVNAEAVLAVADIGYDDIDEQRLDFNETADALANGAIEAGFWTVGVPTSSILNLATTKPIHVIALTDDQITAAQEANPLFTRTTLEGGIYKGVAEAVGGIGIANVLVTSSEMPDDLVYAITRALFENIDDLQAIHPAASEITVEFTLTATPVPLHPGAIRYYEEVGAVIPDHLRP